MCQEGRPLMVALASATTIVVAVTVMARVARTRPSVVNWRPRWTALRSRSCTPDE